MNIFEEEMSRLKAEMKRLTKANKKPRIGRHTPENCFPPREVPILKSTVKLLVNGKRW